LDLYAAKKYSDGQGKETDGKLDDWVDVGVFAEGKNDDDEKVLYMQRHRITQGKTKLTVQVDQQPDSAGFDPYNKLIDRVSSDNRKKVSL
jgi:ABC-2 type transport system permease protein